ncbi:polyamine aminopropyltransferase [Candidatus Halobeggiatoa sp. HSG11]|nr:polyamine aminopropyltransferase [Candidatus Halobeggiatoa sp. HSG11]
MNLDNNWFTELNSSTGCAFSLHIKSKLHEEQTPFQNIIIYQTTKFGNLMVLDGYVMLTERDNFIYHEMITHPVLFTHPKPRKVAIIGGGDCGSLREVTKHSYLEQIIQIEIDERVTRLAEQYFPSLCESNNDPRVKFQFEDAIQWIAKAPDNSLDVIIVDSTDPLGHGEGLFTTAFFRDCRRVLGSKGLLVQQSESPLLHLPLLQSIHKSMREGGFKSTKTLQFPLPVYPSGWWTATMAGDNLTYLRAADAYNEPINTNYYNADIQKASFILPNFLIEALPE